MRSDPRFEVVGEAADGVELLEVVAAHRGRRRAPRRPDALRWRGRRPGAAGGTAGRRRRGVGRDLPRHRRRAVASRCARLPRQGPDRPQPPGPGLAVPRGRGHHRRADRRRRRSGTWPTAASPAAARAHPAGRSVPVARTVGQPQPDRRPGPRRPTRPRRSPPATAARSRMPGRPRWPGWSRMSSGRQPPPVVGDRTSTPPSRRQTSIIALVASACLRTLTIASLAIRYAVTRRPSGRSMLRSPSTFQARPSSKTYAAASDERAGEVVAQRRRLEVEQQVAEPVGGALDRPAQLSTLATRSGCPLGEARGAAARAGARRRPAPAPSRRGRPPRSGPLVLLRLHQAVEQHLPLVGQVLQRALGDRAARRCRAAPSPAPRLPGVRVQHQEAGDRDRDRGPAAQVAQRGLALPVPVGDHGRLLDLERGA